MSNSSASDSTIDSDNAVPEWQERADEALEHYWETGELPENLEEEELDEWIANCERAMRRRQRGCLGAERTTEK